MDSFKNCVDFVRFVNGFGFQGYEQHLNKTLT